MRAERQQAAERIFLPRGLRREVRGIGDLDRTRLARGMPRRVEFQLRPDVQSPTHRHTVRVFLERDRGLIGRDGDRADVVAVAAGIAGVSVRVLLVAAHARLRLEVVLDPDDRLQRAAFQELDLHRLAEGLGREPVRPGGGPAAVAEPEALHGRRIAGRDLEFLLHLTRCPAARLGRLLLLIAQQGPLVREGFAIRDADAGESVGDLIPALRLVFRDGDERRVGRRGLSLDQPPGQFFLRPQVGPEQEFLPVHGNLERNILARGIEQAALRDIDGLRQRQFQHLVLMREAERLGVGEGFGPSGDDEAGDKQGQAGQEDGG